MGALSSQSSISCGLPECVVADAALVEPLSALKSLLSGKRTGKFLIPCQFAAKRPEYPQGFSDLSAKFPTHPNRQLLESKRVFSEIPLNRVLCPLLPHQRASL